MCGFVVGCDAMVCVFCGCWFGLCCFVVVIWLFVYFVTCYFLIVLMFGFCGDCLLSCGFVLCWLLLVDCCVSVICMFGVLGVGFWVRL